MKQRRMRRSFSVALMVCAILTMLAPPGYGRSTAARNITTSLFIPFEGSVTTNSETVDLTGTIHVVVKSFAPVDPCHCVPPNPIRIHTNIISIEGVGQTTGAIYKVTGAAGFEFELEATNTYVFQAGYRFTPLPPPIIEGGPIPPPILPVRYSLTLDSLGEVLEATAVVGHISVDS